MAAAFLFVAQCCAQPPRQPPAQHVLYHMLFNHLGFLKQKASEIRSVGKNGDALERHYQLKIGLTVAENAALVARAALCEEEVARLDETTRSFIDNVRKQRVGPRTFTPPEPPAELIRLQTEREAVILRHIGQLQREPGNAAFQKVDAYLRGDFARNITIQSLTPGSNSDPGSRRLQKLRTARRAKAVSR